MTLHPSQMMANAPLMKNDKENKEKNLPGFEYNALNLHCLCPMFRLDCDSLGNQKNDFPRRCHAKTCPKYGRVQHRDLPYYQYIQLAKMQRHGLEI
ncbi:hypothetical protein OUZ56_009387 [Daphnia magna]|uniref:Uncharacterized protein n=1 Tax=Daphnia magna TaxID=35525 RepID=A0ABR0AFV9_9CRUS|nr:hypothetical protein OUZ56_009387 [Daphnia magna]